MRQLEKTFSIMLGLFGAYQVYAGDIRLGLAVSIVAILAYMPNEEIIAKAVFDYLLAKAKEQHKCK